MIHPAIAPTPTIKEMHLLIEERAKDLAAKARSAGPFEDAELFSRVAEELASLAERFADAAHMMDVRISNAVHLGDHHDCNAWRRAIREEVGA